jgi:hypothetical protein
LELQSSESAFNAIWVAPSIILSLGITRLCSDTVSLIRSRRRARMDWIPLIWVACIFIWQIQYIWAIIELPKFIRIWTLSEFSALLSLSLALFFAAALVLPDEELELGASLEDNFILHGRWALIALSVWGFLAVLVDLWMFSEPLLSQGPVLMIIVASVPLLFLATESRRTRAVITIGNLVLTLWTAWVLSPKAY